MFSPKFICGELLTLPGYRGWRGRFCSLARFGGEISRCGSPWVSSPALAYLDDSCRVGRRADVCSNISVVVKESSRLDSSRIILKILLRRLPLSCSARLIQRSSKHFANLCISNPLLKIANVINLSRGIQFSKV